MSYWYLASPYSNYQPNRQAAYDDILAVLEKFCVAGIPAFSPIVHTHPVDCHNRATTEKTIPYQNWLDADFAMLRQSAGVLVVVLPGWSTSTGVGKEMKYAAEIGKPVFLFSPARADLEPFRVPGRVSVHGLEAAPHMQAVPSPKNDFAVQAEAHRRFVSGLGLQASPAALTKAFSKGEGEAPLTRTFDTGATRGSDTEKLDFEGFLSPLVLKAFGEYMHKNRYLPDGSLRASDNWQKGIPLADYMKSSWRHFFGWWSKHRKPGVLPEALVEDLCGVLFNGMGYLHETLKAQKEADYRDGWPGA